MKQSVRMGHPLGGIKRDDWPAFFNSLDRGEKETLKQSIKWYEKTYQPEPETEAERREKKQADKTETRKDRKDGIRQRSLLSPEDKKLLEDSKKWSKMKPTNSLGIAPRN